MPASLDLSPLWLSLRVAGLATLTATVLGIGIGYLPAEGRWRGRNAVEALLTLPLVLPPTVLGYYLLVALGRRGPIGALFERLTGSPLVFTWQAAVIAATVASLPYVMRTARAAFEAVDPSVREATRLDGATGIRHGATGIRQLVLVRLPLAQRGIAAGVTLAFARALGEFGATLMVAGNIPGRTRTMPIAIYDAVQSGQFDLAAVLVAVLTVVAIGVLVMATRVDGQV